MLLEELIMEVNNTLTFSGAIPSILNRQEIERIIENEAKPYFYREVYESLQIEYIYVPDQSMSYEPVLQGKSIVLPCNVQFVRWLYQTNLSRFFSSISAEPQLAVINPSSQSILSSTYETIGNVAVAKAVLDSFSDMMNQFNKHTVKFDFNQHTKKLSLLSTKGVTPYVNNYNIDLVVETYTAIPDEDLFDSTLFREYVRERSKIRLGEMLKFIDYTLPGNIKINADSIITEGTNRFEKLMERIKSTQSNAIIMMVKK
jgi:hypothetical protein